MRERGLEPPHLAALAPQTSVSTIPPLARICYSSIIYRHRVVYLIYSPLLEMFGRLAQLARAPRLHRGGRGFEPLSAHQIKQPGSSWFFYLAVELK